MHFFFTGLQVKDTPPTEKINAVGWGRLVQNTSGFVWNLLLPSH